MICTAIATALAAAAPGAIVATGPITCPDRVTIAKLPAKGSAVTLDATGATFQQGITLSAVNGLNIVGGTYGSRDADTVLTYAIQGGGLADVSVAGATFLGGPSGVKGGLQFRASTRVTVRDSVFYGHRTGLSLYEVTDALAARNTFLEATSDGINVVGSQRFIVGANTCHWTVRVGLAHPDCIQLWSLVGKPLQSDGWIVNNKGTGNMQGILSSDPKTGTGTRLHFHGNYMAVMFSHTVSCGACTFSTATDNVLSSYPGAYYGVMGGKLKGFEDISNTVARNVVANGTVTLPPRTWWLGVPDIAGKVGSAFDDQTFNPVSVETAP